MTLPLYSILFSSQVVNTAAERHILFLKTSIMVHELGSINPKKYSLYYGGGREKDAAFFTSLLVKIIHFFFN